MSQQAGDMIERVRLDKWLFFARVVKSRSLAAKLAQAGAVRVNGDKTDSAAKLLKSGDVLTITLERRIAILKLVSPGARRGPADEARLLYEDLTPPPEPKADKAWQARPPERDAGAGRPTKKDRRAIDKLMPDETGE